MAQPIETALLEVQAAPRAGAAWGKLGTLLLLSEFKSEADFTFDQAARLSPRDARWPYLRGMLHLDGEPTAALDSFRIAADLSGDEPDMPRLRVAQLLLEAGSLDAAVEQFQRLLRHDPRHPPALLGLARVRLAQGRVQESAEVVARCVDDPHTARSAQALLARVQQQLGNTAAAQAAADGSARLPPDRPWPDPFWEEAMQCRAGKKARLEDVEALLNQGEFGAAMKALAGVTNEYPQDAEALYQMGWILNQTHQGPDAERLLREFLRRTPASPKGHAQLAAALLAQERYGDAAAVLERGLQLEPAWSELHFNLGYACARLGRSEAAIRHLRDALQYDPNYVDSYVLLADLLNRRGEAAEATRLLRQALAIDPADPRLRVRLQRSGDNQ